MGDVLENLEYARVGQDQNGDDVIEGGEGTIECAIAELSGLMAMPVAVP